ncbi:MAG: hypothetical protein QOF78_3281 [Phycisphaerales bacterium]|jgi:hypothetical protein|nr:hypothetical protein [Phycisphaerales bacterium]
MKTDPRPAQSPPGDDPLSHLHKMSTTAGLGSGEYVAVNGAAVFALILGLFSALTLFEEILLILPLTCIVVAIIAWRQINQSNGTQTGKSLVAVALACALGFGGFVVIKETTRGLRTRDDRAAINRAVIELGDKIKAGDMTGAYLMFSDNFRQTVDTERFNRQMNLVRESELLGKLKGTEWNGLAEFQNDAATGQRYAFTKVKMNLDKTTLDVETMLRKDKGRWIFENMSTLFPPPERPRQ